MTNRVTRVVAGWLPGFAIVVHRGRKSGKEYRTPVNAFRTKEGYRIALTYGSGATGGRNVLTAGRRAGCAGEAGCEWSSPGWVRMRGGGWAPAGVRQVLGVIEAGSFWIYE
ncbi:MAG: hypothetical protein U0232_07475 [Thermomicrobiales bacterium]